MVRFSCFSAHIHSHKSKKTSPPSLEAMYKSLQDSHQNKFIKKSSESASIVNTDRGWKSDELLNTSNEESDLEVDQTCYLKKSQSLGSRLYREGKNLSNNSGDNEFDQVLSCGESNDLNDKNQNVTPDNLYQELSPESLQVSSNMLNDNNESIFSIGDTQNLEKDVHGNVNFDNCEGDLDHYSRTPPSIVKSDSVPNIEPHLSPIIGDFSNMMIHSSSRCRSLEDLQVLDMRWKENSENGRGKEKCYSDKNDEIHCDELYDSYNYVGSSKDWIMPNPDEVKLGKNNFEGQTSSANQWNDYPSKDFKIKRIEDWVTDLQHCSSLEETGEPSFANHDQVIKGTNGLNGLSTAKLDAKATLGMEAAKRYISSLSAAATTAQLTNHGLVVVPFLSAFVSLKVLNLSGNSIVRITAGALPRGLHMLNLSKNHISTIEGLRELTRLRILDLSYNKIVRIGHGLASCSSLKELYLAGNKISEVEGLHRLLKLNVLDLRFNKISTAKCLGQLAANYNSLQAISLEGNPAQKNVGDEHLKKYLQGLLTHLTYYNRQPIKASALKDGSDKTVRLGSGGHQFDRKLRSELKPVRKASHGSSSRVRKGGEVGILSPSVVKGKNVRLPPSGVVKVAANPPLHNYLDLGRKFMSLKQDVSMRKSRSEGNLGAL